MRSGHTVDAWPLAPYTEGGHVFFPSVVEKAKGSRTELWYSVPESSPCRPGNVVDPFAIASLFVAMAGGAGLRIHGEVSPVLLRNLEELSRVWHRWKPDRYRPVEVSADHERERQGPPPARFLAAFSGGVDSLFTLYRHATGRCGRQRRPVTDALMVHGFDIPLDNGVEWNRAWAGARETCGALGIRLLAMRTNWRALGVDWEDGFGAALASCLTFFAGQFQGALIAASETYDYLLPWGATPLTIPMFSSERFEIVNDGAGFSRVEKTAVLSGWPEGCRNLRVCWEGPRRDQNCCRCEKCIRTILDFRASAGRLPPCFESDVTLDQIRSLRLRNEVQVHLLQDIVDHVRQIGRSDEEWVRVLERRLRAVNLRRTKKALIDAVRNGMKGLLTGRFLGR